MKNKISHPLSQYVLPAVILLLLSFAIRIPSIHLVPHWSGGNENYLALDILDGARPLTNQNPHLGALSPYLVALAFSIFGVNPLVPRMIPLFFGVATILLTWRLGAQSGNARTGFLAAILMAPAWYHVVFSSHYPWSNSLTPFFATAFLLILHHLSVPDLNLASGRARTVLALSAGLVFGLGMQTHPEMVTLAPVAVLILILRARHVVGWLKHPAPWLMGTGAVIGYGNMIWFNIQHRFQGVSYGLTYPEYALTQDYSATSVAGNYWQEFLYLPRIILGFYDDAIAWNVYARNPVIWMFWLLLVIGTLLRIRSGRFLVPAAFWSMFLIIPAINSNYTLYLGRYLVFMFPPALILIAETLDACMRASVRSRLEPVVRLSAAGIVAVLFLLPLHAIRDYYRHCTENGQTRERYFHLSDILKQSALSNPLLILDEETGESFEFRHFLRENRYRVETVRFRGTAGNNLPLEDAIRPALQTHATADFDGIILILSPMARHHVLCLTPARRFLGQIDARFGDDIVDFYRVYEL